MGTRAARILNLPDASGSNGNGTTNTRRFGVFELDLRAGELRRNGIKIKLQDQPFQVLALLLERPGEVISREEVRNRLWPADTFVDFDHSLNAAIRRLRDALGDSAENPTFVETVARRGYRFLAPVSTESANGGGGATVVGPVAVELTELKPRRRWWMIAAIVAGSMIVAGAIAGFLLIPRSSAPGRISRLTANPVDDPIIAAAISRDGRHLAFSDETGFYLREIDSGETHSIALPDGLSPNSISWFPDSIHMVVSLCAINRESSIWEFSALGGGARKLVDAGRSPAISPDGKQVAYLAGRTLHERVWLTNTEGEQPRELAGEDGDLFGRIGWSPDGKNVAFTTAKFNYGYGAKGMIAVVTVRPSSDSGTRPRPTIAMSVFGLDGPLAWAPDGRLIYTQQETRPRQADSNLWAIRLDRHMKPGAAPVRLTSDQGAVLDISASADSKRIVYLKGLPEPDVYVGRLEPSGTVNEPQRLTLDDRIDMPFDWTADSKSVIFQSDRTGSFDVYKQDIHKTMPELLVSGALQLVQPRLSPDGTQVLYIANPNWGDMSFQTALMAMSMNGGTAKQIAKAEWISNHQCSRFPASACIYSVVTEGALTFFQFDLEGGAARQIFQVKDELPQIFNWSLSPDGTTLAIAKGKFGDEEPRIHLVSLTGAPERWVTVRGWPALASLDWAADSKSIWAATNTEKENALLRIDLQGNARLVWQPKKGSVNWAIPSRDGKYLALHVHSNTANVWMLEH